jgi:glycosyltransferase involved in cell wall biosynthesis
MVMVMGTAMVTGTVMGTERNRTASHARKLPLTRFVLIGCGDRHVARINLALYYLKKTTRTEIVVLRARSGVSVDHDQVIDCLPPSQFTNAESSVALKTNVHRLVGNVPGYSCYLDSDVIPVRPLIDQVFKHHHGEVSFARDHVNIDRLSRYIVPCQCIKHRCGHLRQEILKTFDVEVTDGRWVPWNGGVFVFGSESADFLDTWHRYTITALSSAVWASRDQGTLAAVIWKRHLERAPRLPRQFNWIVDGYAEADQDKRRELASTQLTVDRTYRLTPPSRSGPICLHFINDTVGRKGWKNWDDVEVLYTRSHSPIEQREPVDTDNRIVHGMWIGQSLSKLELLTLHSFVAQGHEFHLWVYEPICTPLPDGVVLQDASSIIPQRDVFNKQQMDKACGVGKDSYAPFSDLFRYKLLYDRGGYWVDMDVTCLKPFIFKEPYLFRSHPIGVMGNIMKAPRHSRLMKRAYEETLKVAGKNVDWLYANRILSREVRRSRLMRAVRSDICNEDSWTGLVGQMMEREIEVPDKWYAIHWLNEVNRTIRQNGGRFMGFRLPFVPDKDNPKDGSTLRGLYRRYSLICPESPAPESNKASSTANRHSLRHPHEHINILVPTLNTGGAERSVIDVLSALPTGYTAQLFVIAKSQFSFDVSALVQRGVQIELLDGYSQDGAARMIAARVQSSPNPALYYHLPDSQLLAILHGLGVKTIPVIQNLHSAWRVSALALNHPNVLFVSCVSDAVAREQRAFGCRKRIVSIRHEVDPETRLPTDACRTTVRAKLGVSDDAIVIGMIGQFKTQKCYPRAIEIFSAVTNRIRAKLLIVGGWDRDNPDSRTSYEDTLQAVREFGLEKHVAILGNISSIGEYLRAIDVYLNTSSFEGLSVSMLDAQGVGCPIVATDVGGAKETLYPRQILLDPQSSSEEFVDAILRSKDMSRCSAKAPEPRGLIPFIWSMLATYGWGHPSINSEEAVDVYLCSSSAFSDAKRVAMRYSNPQQTAFGVFGRPSLEIQEELELLGACVRHFPDRDVLFNSWEALRYIAGQRASTVYLVGLDIKVRLVLSKILSPQVTLFDVQDSVSLFSALENDIEFQQRICSDASAYYSRLRSFPPFRNGIFTSATHNGH